MSPTARAGAQLFKPFVSTEDEAAGFNFGRDKKSLRLWLIGGTKQRQDKAIDATKDDGVDYKNQKPK